LPRARRLTRPDEFHAVRDAGFQISDPLFLIRVAPNSAGGVRIGVTVSRRVSTKAVSRNRIKRQIRESVRVNQAMFPDIDIVVVARPAAASATNARLTQALRNHWDHVIRRCKQS